MIPPPLLKIKKYSIQFLDTNFIRNYGYAIEITNKPAYSWHSTNMYYTRNNTFIIDNEATNVNGYQYPIQIPPIIGDRYRITILAKQFPNSEKIQWSISGYNNFIPITSEEVSNDYIILSDTRTVLNGVQGDSNLHFLFPKGITEIESILIENINDKFNLSKDGYLLFNSKDRIYTVFNNIYLKYTLRISPIYIYIMALFIIIFIFFIDLKNINKCNDFFTEKRFIILIIIFSLILFVFQFWLCFPGYYDYPDGHYIFKEAITNQYTNWHPIIIGLTLHILFNIFGYNTFYIFFINLFLWYGGLILIIISLYLKFKNRLLILLLLISFIGNIFFMNINHLKDTTSSLFVWFAYSIIFFQILTNNKKLISQIILSLLCLVSLLFGILWRHNMIVTIYPIFIFYSFMIINKIGIKNIKIKILSFVLSIGIFAVILILIVKLFPLIFIKNTHNDSVNHLFYLQIAGIAVLSGDSSIIPNDMYKDNITFEDVIKLYQQSSNIADFYTRLFKYNDNLISIWIKSIIKHPLSYLNHIFNYSKDFLIIKPYHYPPSTYKSWILNPNAIQSKNKPFYFEEDVDYFYLNKGIELSPLRYSLYLFIYNWSIRFEIYIYATVTLILFIFSIILNIKYKLKIDLLIFLFSTASSSIATILIVLLFTPITDYRYMYPVIPISIISLISFITFIYDRGGFKNFIKELSEDKK